jgi:hypothetical protein
VQAAPAHAVLAYQTVGPVSWSITGATPSTSTTPTAFAGFNTVLGTLSGVKLTDASGNNITGAFGGSVPIGQFDSVSRTYNAKLMSLGFTFSDSGSSTISYIGNAPVTLTPNTLSAPSFGPITAIGSGSFSGSTTSITTNTPALRSYFSATPTISNITGSWDFSTNPVNGAFLTPNSLTLSSTALYLTYEYDDGKLPAGAPSPLPILGASIAFRFSRKLRQRIASAA